MRASARCAWWMIGTLAFAALPAFAQEPAQKSDGTLVPEAQLSPEESAILGNALVFDPTALATPPKKPLRFPGLTDKGYDVTRTDKLDGSTTVVVKQPLNTEWINSVGADLAPSNTGASSAYDRPLPATRDGFGSSGAAWASLGVQNIGSVDARVDPSNEQGKIGTTLKQSIPFGSRFAVTVQDTYSVTDTLGQPTGPSDLPLMALPSGAAPATSQVYGNEKAVKFNILPTGTTLGAGVTTASNDPVTHNTISAEQKLYGPLQVTTAVTDFGQTTSSKSITAGLKLHW
ncbi:MAG TPA: hypothetical protein VKD19_11390 [Pseudolabrys sp.]|nr:hypothetical protein [Pseudolabrys sp.]